VILRREPHWIRILSTSGCVTVSFKYWQLHSTGHHRDSLYRRFLSRTVGSICQPCRPRRRQLHCRRCALSFVREVAHFSANLRACRSDFYDNVGRLPNRRANMTCAILYFRSRLFSATPFPDFSSPSTAYFVCLLIFANLYARFPHVSEKRIANVLRNMAGLYALK